MNICGGITVPGTGSEVGLSNPRQLPNLAAWFRSDQGITIGTGVSQWNDISGNGHNVTQAVVAQQPAFVASNANLAGKPSLTFSAAAVSALDNTTDTVVAQSGARTIFAVLRPSDAVGGTVIDFKRTGTDFAFQLYPTGGGLAPFVFGDGATINIRMTTTPVILNTNFYLTYVDSGTGTTLVMRVNGAGVAVDSANSMPAETAGTGFTIGNRVVNGQSLTGDIAEIIVYSRALSAAEYSLVEAYLKGRYAI